MSQANYILICSGRGKVLAADRPADIIASAMECAADFICFNQLVRPHKMEALADSVREVSLLQHTMMDSVLHTTRPEAISMADQMLALLDVLEDKIEES